MECFTQKHIAQMSDLEFAAAVMRMHADSAKNPNTALAKKYRMAAYCLECFSHTDGSGHKKSYREIPDHELNRIGTMVARGYACGEIITEEEA